MKGSLNALIGLAVGLTGGYLLHDAAPSVVLAEDEIQIAGAVEGQGWDISLRGDVNADGRLDISDATFILNYCFLAGTRPTDLPTTQGRGLLETGQTRCFDGTRGLEQDPCPAEGTDDYGQDANYRAGLRRNFQLVRVDESDPLTWYTIDHASGLMWQHRDPVRRHWRGALHNAENLELGGFDDWRMPNIRELISIVNFGTRSPSINAEFFHVIPTVYWSSTTTPFDGSRVFTVRFSEGLVGLHEKGQAGIGPELFYSLAVRNSL